MESCNHEESDTRMLIHAAHVARQGHTKVALRTVDTDVLAIAVSQMNHLGLAELEFGVGKTLSCYFSTQHCIKSR